MNGVEVGCRTLFSLRLKTSLMPAQPHRQTEFLLVREVGGHIQTVGQALGEFDLERVVRTVAQRIEPGRRPSLYSGKGRSDCATLAVQGNPA